MRYSTTASIIFSAQPEGIDLLTVTFYEIMRFLRIIINKVSIVIFINILQNNTLLFDMVAGTSHGVLDLHANFTQTHRRFRYRRPWIEDPSAWRLLKVIWTAMGPGHRKEKPVCITGNLTFDSLRLCMLIAEHFFV